MFLPYKFYFSLHHVLSKSSVSQISLYFMQAMSEQPKKLLIIDGYGFIFRAYHVQPALSSPDGLPVGAIYGFTSMLLKLLNDFKPERAVIVLDSGGKNFRHHLYDKYKANRPPAPDDLVVQLPLVKEAAKALNFQVLEKSGFEADDIIASLARRANELSKEAIVISSDKDLMQLINNYIKMYDPVKAKYILVEDVIAKFGVEPTKLREVQALIGDKSDNIPGVAGIGPKTASQLINSYGTVEEIFNSIEQISNQRQKDLLLKDKENAFLSWQLVGLDNNVDIDLDINNFIWQPPAANFIAEFLHKYGFRSLIKRTENLFSIKISEAESFVTSTMPTSSIKIISIETEQDFEKILKIIEKEGVIGVELVLNNNDMRVNLAVGGGIYSIDYSGTAKIAADLFAHSKKQNFAHNLKQHIQDLFTDSSIKKITFNLKQILKAFDFTPKAFEDLKLIDYCLSAGTKPKTIAELIKTYVIGDEQNKNNEELVGYYVACYNKLLKELVANKVMHLYQEIDLPLCYIIDDMEKQGIKLDVKYLETLSASFTVEITKLEQQIFAISGVEFNVSSPKQVGEILFDKMQLPFGKVAGKSKTYVTNSEILEKLKYEGYKIADLLIKYRHFTKLKNTYTDSLPKQLDKLTNRVHTTFLQTSTATGRLSSNEPNVQNIPIRSEEGNKIRAAFIARDGYKLISADYSQIELRILSHVADIKVLRDAFIHKLDIHAQTASQIFGVKLSDVTPEIRRRAKAINFGIIYGISAFGLAKQLNITTKEAANYMEKYFQEYPGIENYMKQIIEFAKKHGYVQNLLGRKCFLPTINDQKPALRSFAQRAAINAPMQSLAADIVKIAMVNVFNALEAHNLETKMLLQIHDELIFEAPDAEVEQVQQLIKGAMELAYKLAIPISVDIGTGNNWQEIH